MTTNAVTIILYVLLVLAVMGGIGAVAYFTSGFTTDFQTFYLRLDDEDILESVVGIEFIDGKDYLFEVKYTFGELSKQKTGYSVKIIPNQETDFNFLVDGESHSLQELGDITSCFDITYQSDKFTVLGNARLQDVLQRYYAENTVELVDEIQEMMDYYTIVVTSYNGKASVRVGFHGEDAGGTFRINPDPIVF